MSCPQTITNLGLLICNSAVALPCSKGPYEQKKNYQSPPTNPTLGPSLLIGLEECRKVRLPLRKVWMHGVPPALGPVWQILCKPGVLKDLVHADTVWGMWHKDLA